MKLKNFLLFVVSFVLVVSLVNAVSAWDIKRPLRYTFADSNTSVNLDVDSADLSGKTVHADTTYYPDKHGYNFGWPDQLLFRYGVAVIDGTPFPEGALESDSGHSLLFAVDVDSAHIGVAIETSFEGSAWVIAFEDSTLRATASSRSTNSHLLNIQSMMDDTLIGPRYRARCIIYRDVDSTETDLYNVDDTVRLDRLEIWGLGFVE